ncbi:MAG: M23 family peptidase, partial [Alphaproteobacteria bacterium]|nr:M23 family peptidase [Alphaproteobacteria bacterium]
MILRRQVLTGALALTVLPRFARAETPLFTLHGSLEQGSLVTGHTAPDATLSLDDSPLSLSPDGAFAFGIAYDRTAPLRLVARLGHGRSEERAISPVPRVYQTQSITGLPQAYVTPPPDILARIRA